MKQLIRRFPRVHNSAKPFQIQSSNVFVAVLSSDIVSVLILCSLFFLSTTSPPSCATLAGVYGWCDPNLRRSWNHSSFSPKRWLHVYKQAFDGIYYRHPENGPGRQMPPIMTPLKPRACCCETTLQKVWTLRWLGLSFECSISFFFCCLFWWLMTSPLLRAVIS